MEIPETPSILCTKRHTMSQKYVKNPNMSISHKIPDSCKKKSLLLGERAIRFPIHCTYVIKTNETLGSHVISQSHVAGHIKVAPPYDPKDR